MLVKRAFGKEPTKNMQLWGPHHSTDIKLGQNAAFVWEAACDKNRNFMRTDHNCTRSLVTCPQPSNASLIVVQGTRLGTAA